VTQNQRLVIIQQEYARWAKQQSDVQPDPQYVHDGPSQYAEGMVALSAPTSQQDELHRRVREALERAGLPLIP